MGYFGDNNFFPFYIKGKKINVPLSCGLHEEEHDDNVVEIMESCIFCIAILEFDNIYREHIIEMVKLKVVSDYTVQETNLSEKVEIKKGNVLEVFVLGDTGAIVFFRDTTPHSVLLEKEEAEKVFGKKQLIVSKL